MSQGEVMGGRLTDQDLAKLVELEKAATPGPWKRIAQGGSSTITTLERPGRNDTRIPGYAYRDEEHCLAYPFIEDDGRTRLDFVCFSHADAALIAATRNALPALLAADAAVRTTSELRDLRAMVHGECPSLLEDHFSAPNIDAAIEAGEAAIEKATKP